VPAEASLRKFVSRRSAERGDAYFSQGRVRRIAMLPGGVIEAHVQGSRLYSVDLIVDDDALTVRCDCPWFTQNLEECKHIWAAIRAASARRLLPERSLVLLVDDDAGVDDEVIENVRRFTARGARAPWEQFLDAVGPAPIAAGKARNLPDEIIYVVLPSTRSQALTLRIVGRTRKKNGEWSKWKPLSLRVDALHALPPFDRETLGLLHQRMYALNVEPMISIPPVTTAWWIERLARAGRLFLMDSDAEPPQPIAWDDGPPWRLRVAIVSDAAKRKYRVAGTLERDGEALPIESVTAIVNGVLIAGGRASRFDDGGATPWLHALRGSGGVEIPHADAERFRQSLLRLPLDGVVLPQELGWEVVDAEPSPLLSLKHDGWSAELHGELFFVYDGWRVSSRSEEMRATAGRKLIRRNAAREAALRGRLASTPAIATWDGYRVRLSQLEELAQSLAAEGWAIEIDAAPLRVADDLDVEISSGIDWFDLEMSASFGEQRVALPELLAAADAKRSLLRLPDGSFGIVPASWQGALTPLLDFGRREGDAIRFRSVQALLVDALLQARVPRADDAFTAMRERLAAAAPAPRKEPPTLTATLRPYQRAGLGWLHFLREAGVGGCLADDMGLGKTVQTLALLDAIRAGGGDRLSLVVAPRSLLFNWAAEAKRFAPRLRVREHHGPDREKHAESFAGCDVVLTTYATMRLDIAHLAKTEFEYVVLDEAQAIKNASSQVAKASRLLHARHRLALSGTPIENHLGELWSLFEFLNPGLLGSSRSFHRTFAAKETPPERREALARALRPLILRRTKEQVAPELPERTEQTLYCELEGKQKRLYDELRDHYRAALLGSVRKTGIEKSRMLILEALLRLRQAACHPGLIDGNTAEPSAKTELLLEELADVIDSGHRALVFSQFTSFLAIVRRGLEERRVDYCYLDGKTRDRQSIVERFQSASGPPAFLISLKAGGLGLNLTNADYIFLLDPWWNPAVEAQAIDRAHRIGRLRPVVAYRLIARDTVEEKILELQAQKRELAESIISEDNSVLRKLNVEDLELLLS
jgi:superfamily II DNA or RNA helicase